MADEPADETVAGVLLITVPLPPAVTDGPPLPDPPIAPGSASVTYHAAREDETLDDVVARVAGPGQVGARLLAVDIADAVEMRLDPSVVRVRS